MATRKLSTYRAKRDFTRTAEPSGAQAVRPTRQLCFVIQKHAARMAADDPQRYRVNLSKKPRTGRIFLDYLRNDRMATAVAPLSPRTRDGAPVPMPLEWNQVKSGPDPARYTLRSTPALIANSTVWEDYGDGERSLRSALHKLS